MHVHQHHDTTSNETNNPTSEVRWRKCYGSFGAEYRHEVIRFTLKAIYGYCRFRCRILHRDGTSWSRDAALVRDDRSASHRRSAPAKNAPEEENEVPEKEPQTLMKLITRVETCSILRSCVKLLSCFNSRVFPVPWHRTNWETSKRPIKQRSSGWR